MGISKGAYFPIGSTAEGMWFIPILWGGDECISDADDDRWTQTYGPVSLGCKNHHFDGAIFQLAGLCEHTPRYLDDPPGTFSPGCVWGVYCLIVSAVVNTVIFTDLVLDLWRQSVRHILEMCVVRLHVFQHNSVTEAHQIMDFGWLIAKDFRRHGLWLLAGRALHSRVGLEI